MDGSRSCRCWGRRELPRGSRSEQCQIPRTARPGSGALSPRGRSRPGERTRAQELLFWRSVYSSPPPPRRVWWQAPGALSVPCSQRAYRAGARRVLRRGPGRAGRPPERNTGPRRQPGRSGPARIPASGSGSSCRRCTPVPVAGRAPLAVLRESLEGGPSPFGRRPGVSAGTRRPERDRRLEAAQAATPARSHAQAAELLLTENRDRALSGQFRLSQNLELLRCSDERFQASRWRGVPSRCWTDVGYQVP